jgi:hypothetical protein
LQRCDEREVEGSILAVLEAPDTEVSRPRPIRTVAHDRNVLAHLEASALHVECNHVSSVIVPSLEAAAVRAAERVEAAAVHCSAALLALARRQSPQEKLDVHASLAVGEMLVAALTRSQNGDRIQAVIELERVDPSAVHVLTFSLVRLQVGLVDARRESRLLQQWRQRRRHKSISWKHLRIESLDGVIEGRIRIRAAQDFANSLS